MCCHVRSASASRRRHRPKVPSQPLALLDLSKPCERQAHDFLVRATSKPDRMWQVLGMHRRGDVLLCVVRWVRCKRTPMPFALVNLSLTEAAVCWRDYVSAETALTEMEVRCSADSPDHQQDQETPRC